MANKLCLELLLVQLPEPARHRDSSTSEGKTLVDYHATIQKIPGVETVYWSARVEDPSKGVFAIIWTDFAAAETGAKHPSLGPAIAAAAGACAAPPTILYVTPATSPLPALDSPATELFLAVFPPDADADTTDAFGPGVATMLAKGEAARYGLRAHVGGWMATGIPFSKVGKEGRGRAYVHLFGWGSVAEHRAWRETPGFLENVHVMRDKGNESMEMFHILKN